MSDQDFFFDEDERSSAPAKAAPSKPAGKASAARPQQKGATRPQTPAASSGSFFEQKVPLSVASLLAVIGLLLGVIIGVLVAPGRGGADIGSPTGTSAAPPLSSEQLQSGELPPGHPDISGMTGTETTGTGETTGSVETTQN